MSLETMLHEQNEALRIELANALEQVTRWQGLYKSADECWDTMFETSEGWQKLYRDEKKYSADWQDRYLNSSKMVKALQYESPN